MDPQEPVAATSQQVGSMLELQRHLEMRFNSLRDKRTGPIFFLEHGLMDFGLSRPHGYCTRFPRNIFTRGS